MSGSEQSPTTPTTTRRTLLTASAATAATLLAGASSAQAADSTSTSTSTDVTAGLRALEEQHTARVGVFAHHLGTRKTVVHRADELFPMCSTFKTLAAAAVLRDLDRHGEVLYKVVHYTEADLVDGSDQTRAHLADGMTVEQLADVAVRFSDNGAGNLILRELGGPTAVTRFARSLGDPVTRLDRWETELNSAEPDRITDTTSPRAIAGLYRELVLGDALRRPDRDRLTAWLLNNTTSAARFRAGLPATWTIADKTGSGAYGTANDVGIAWTEAGDPVVLAVLTTKPTLPDAPYDNQLVASTAKLVAEAIS
ncbi:class A beta-lactamase [Streptomyces sp. NBC_01261]|uniref:class A beta-lactamase n=1 Tax=Streptomyces sp. NBC_01261 TaxID=2903802 RepID=UPI003FCE8E25